MNSTSLKGSTAGEGLPSQPGSKQAQAKSKAQTKGLTAFGLLFKGQAKGDAKDKGDKPEVLDAKAMEAAAQLAQLMAASKPPSSPLKMPSYLSGSATEDAATALAALKKRGVFEQREQQLQLASEPKPQLGKEGRLQADPALSLNAGTILPAGTLTTRQDLPGRQDFTASLDQLQRTLSSNANTDAPYDHQLLLRTFEGGGQLELELGSGDLASRLRMTVQDQRVELGFDGKALGQLDKIKQTLIESGFEVTVVPMTSESQGHDQALDQHHQQHHEAARAALDVRLRLRGAQRWDDASAERVDDPHETSRKQARLGVIVDQIV